MAEEINYRDGMLTDPQQALSRIPKTPGIYIVTTMHPAEPDAFLEVGTGVFFKGQNPNVSVQELRQKWVDGASILYIGRAGGAEIRGPMYNATYFRRLIQGQNYARAENIDIVAADIYGSVKTVRIFKSTGMPHRKMKIPSH
jgi:hypothetical protein